MCNIWRRFPKCACVILLCLNKVTLFVLFDYSASLTLHFYALNNNYEYAPWPLATFHQFPGYATWPLATFHQYPGYAAWLDVTFHLYPGYATWPLATFHQFPGYAAWPLATFRDQT